LIEPATLRAVIVMQTLAQTWERDIKKHGHYDLETSGGGAFKHDGTTNNCYEKTENPYIKAFWEWLART